MKCRLSSSSDRRTLTVDKRIHGRVDEVLHHVVAVWVPVRVVSLLGAQLREGVLQTPVESRRNEGIGLDHDVAARVESEYQARLFKEGGFASQLGNRLPVIIPQVSKGSLHAGGDCRGTEKNRTWRNIRSQSTSPTQSYTS